MEIAALACLRRGSRVVERSSRGAVIQISVIRKEIEDQGKKYRCQLLDRKLITPPDSIKQKLELKGNIKALSMQCLHFADEKPYQLEDRWINLKVVSNSKTCVRVADFAWGSRLGVEYAPSGLVLTDGPKGPKYHRVKCHLHRKFTISALNYHRQYGSYVTYRTAFPY